MTTAVDGKESNFVLNGEMEVVENTIKIQYTDKDANVKIDIEENVVQVLRQGDYLLRLRLIQGQLTESVIGIQGSEGEIKTFAEKIAYSLRKDSLLLTMRYDLIMGNETQKMQFRLFAKNYK